MSYLKMSHENYNYEKIQKSLSDQGWTGNVSDIQSIIQTAHNESTVINFINTLKNLILKPGFDIIKPNFYNSEDRVILFEKIKDIIISNYKEPCKVENFESELYEEITINSENLSLSFSIHCSSSLRITKTFNKLKVKPEITIINFSK